MLVLFPLQMVADEGVTVTVGLVPTFTVTVVVEVQPAVLVPVMV
jgi:hypothetical protein